MANSTTQVETAQFINEFLPNHARTLSNPTHNPFNTLQNANTMPEIEVSKLLIAAVNEHDLTPRSRIAPFTTFFGSSTDELSPASNVAMFRPQDVPEGGVPVGVDQTVSLEFRAHRRGIDPFDHAIESSPEKARKRLFDGISSVSELVFAAQQRVFFFMLLFVGRSFRLLRWDRAGVAATPSVDYFEHPDVLCDILWRLSHLDDNALGLDPSATRLGPADIDFLRMDIASLPDPTDVDHDERQLKEDEVPAPFVFSYVRSLFRTSLSRDWPRYKVQVPGADRPREYLVGRPVFRASDMVGRGTRGYVALDCKTGRFVWLKDAWRASYVITETEGDVLCKLNEAGVENVPTLVCHGDIPNQTTLTGDLWERQHPLPSPSRRTPSRSSSTTLPPFPASPGSNKRKREEETPHSEFPRRNTIAKSDCPQRQHKHYRIVMEEVCLPLRDFQYGRQLLLVVLDCLQGKSNAAFSLAHHQAATKPQTPVFHRDISGGNILIYPRVIRDMSGKNPQMIWSGILGDWELAKPIDTMEAASKATQDERMGTYQYMSVNLLNHITKPVEIPDELESFFHVLVYYSVRYLRSNCSCIQSWIDNYFYKYLGPGRTGACGQKSYTIEATGELRVSMMGDPLTFHSPMDAILASILKILKARYRIMYYNAAQAVAPAPIPDPHPEPSPPPQKREPSAAAPSPADSVVAGIDPAVIAQWEAEWEAGLPVDLGPTEEERKLAERLDDHGFMIAFLARQIGNPYWSSDDRIPKVEADAAASECRANDAEATAAPSNRSNKRQRTGERNASLPARLHASTRRTRQRPRTHPVRAQR